VSFIADSWHLFQRHLLATLRLPIWIAITLIQPVIWLGLFGQLFRRVVDIPGFETTSYIEFLTPGVVVMNALFGAAWSGMGLINDLQEGVVDRMLATPVRRGALIAARVLHASFTIGIQSLIILALGLALGAHFASGILGALTTLIPAMLLGAAFAALSSGIALMTRREETLIAIVNFFGLPLSFLSASFMSAALMPDWVRMIATVNPVNWAVTAARAAVAGGNWTSVWVNCALLVAIVIATSVFATRAFRTYRRSA